MLVTGLYVRRFGFLLFNNARLIVIRYPGVPMSRHFYVLILVLLALGCERPGAPESVVHTSGAIGSINSEIATLAIVNKLELGELSRYAGNWVVNGNRNDRRVVLKDGKSEITIYTQKSSGSLGNHFQRSMQMTFDPETRQYTAKIKWSNGGDVKSHIQTPWLDHQLRGTWDEESRTFIWIGKSDTNEVLRELTIETKFLNANRQEHSITPSPLWVDGKMDDETSRCFARDTMARIL